METGAALTGARMAGRAGRSLRHVSRAAANRSQPVKTRARNDRAAHISNRQSKILEFAVTGRKQTTAPHSDRQYFRVVRATNRAFGVPSAKLRARRRDSNRNKTAFKNVANSFNASEKRFSNRNTNPRSTGALTRIQKRPPFPNFGKDGAPRKSTAVAGSVDGSATRRSARVAAVRGRGRSASGRRFSFRSCVELFNDVGKFNVAHDDLWTLARFCFLSPFYLQKSFCTGDETLWHLSCTTPLWIVACVREFRDREAQKWHQRIGYRKILLRKRVPRSSGPQLRLRYRMNPQLSVPKPRKKPRQRMDGRKRKWPRMRLRSSCGPPAGRVVANIGRSCRRYERRAQPSCGGSTTSSAPTDPIHEIRLDNGGCRDLKCDGWRSRKFIRDVNDAPEGRRYASVRRRRTSG